MSFDGEIKSEQLKHFAAPQIRHWKGGWILLVYEISEFTEKMRVKGKLRRW